MEARWNVPSLESVAQAFCSSVGFAFVAKAGQGAFKETFQALDQSAKPVAVKVYRDGLSNQRSGREIDAMRRCSHLHIAQLSSIDTFSYSGTSYLITREEFLPGGTLSSKLIADGLMGDAETKALATPLIDASRHIAALNLVHRDIKPDNILFRSDRRTPVIVDFGLVRDLGATSLTQSWQLQGPGTPFFSPPEQLLNEKILIDWRADQFSLGVTLAMARFGLHPYSHAGDTLDATVGRVMARSVPAPRFTQAAQGCGLPQLITMVAPWPVQRYRTPAMLAAAW